MVLAVLGFLTRFFYLGFPNQVVFDETHYGKYVSGYLTNTHFFDVHPPLSKLLAAFFAWIGNFNPHFDFASIGQTFTDPNYIYLRLAPAICGFLLPIVVYYLAKEIGLSKMTAFFAGLVVVFENSLLVQSKFMLLDGELVFFGMTALLFYMLFRNRKHWAYLATAAVFLGAAISTKWTGIGFLGMCLVIELASFIHDKKPTHWKTLAALVVIPCAIYAGTFAIHFNLLTEPGPGDAFMSQDYQSKGFTDKFIELNEKMWQKNTELTAVHAYSSKWYSWPLMLRPIYYWEHGEEKIYSTGNPFVYWIGFAAILTLLGHALLRTKLFLAKRHAILFILFGYCANYLPYIAVGRVSFLYYYLVALVFAILATALLIDSVRDAKQKRNWLIAVLVVFISGFFYFAPMSYGFPLSPVAQEQHFWLSSWK